MIDINQEKHYFGKILGGYKRKCYLNIINEWVASKKFNRLLKTDLYEEAHGVDDILPYLKNCIHKTGIDNSRFIVNKAFENSKKEFDCVFADLKELPFENEVFDIVFSSSTLDHCNQEIMYEYLKEIHRVLNDKGIVIISINNKHNLALYFANKLEKLLKLSKLQTEFYTTGQLKEIFQKFDFNVRKVDYIFFILPFSKKIINLINNCGNNKLNHVLQYLIYVFERFVKKTFVFKKCLAHLIIFKLTKI